MKDVFPLQYTYTRETRNRPSNTNNFSHVGDPELKTKNQKLKTPPLPPV